MACLRIACDRHPFWLGFVVSGTRPPGGLSVAIHGAAPGRAASIKKEGEGGAARLWCAVKANFGLGEVDSESFQARSGALRKVAVICDDFMTHFLSYFAITSYLDCVCLWWSCRVVPGCGFLPLTTLGAPSLAY